MVLHVNIGWLLAALLLSARVAAATALVPVLGPAQIPGMARVIFAVALGAIILAALPVQPVQIDSVAQLAVAACTEVVIGASLSLGFLAAYAATQVAGRALDIQVGFGIASVLNPSTRAAGSLLGSLLGMAAIAVFLALNGQQVLIRALAASAVSIPPGSLGYAPDWEALLRHSAVMFTYGAALAAPVMLALLLTDISMAVLARSMPLMNVFVLSFSVKVVLALIGLAVSARLSRPLLAGLFDTTFRYWEGVSGAR